jgi:two-component system sensor histidine kinase AlgZ
MKKSLYDVFCLKMRHYTEQHSGRRAAISPHNPKSAIRQFESGGDFLPNLCSVQGVFALVLVGELLSLALVLADGGLRGFEWYKLGVVSLLVEWIVLFSAACLCRLRPWFKGQSPVLAGCISYCIVLAVTLIFTALGQRVQNPDASVDVWHLASNFLIAAVFAGVALRYFFLQQQLQNQQQAELRARIQALQSRIHPHFLFNSMNSIASLIASQPAVAERMVEDLSGLFRASLNDLALIPLRDELDLCNRFVRIEQLRLGDRLHVRWQLPDDLPDALTIPSLLLQPLIENAVYHGVQPLPEGGDVVVTLVLDKGDCSISVANPIAGGSASLGNGLALENIRQRLAAHYGERGQLLIVPEAGVFTVTVRFPVATEPR